MIYGQKDTNSDVFMIKSTLGFMYQCTKSFVTKYRRGIVGGVTFCWVSFYIQQHLTPPPLWISSSYIDTNN